MLLGSFSHDLRAQRDEQRVATDACGYASAMCDSRVCVSAVRAVGELAGSDLRHWRRLMHHRTGCRASEPSCELDMRAARMCSRAPETAYVR